MVAVHPWMVWVESGQPFLNTWNCQSQMSSCLEGLNLFFPSFTPLSNLLLKLSLSKHFLQVWAARTPQHQLGSPAIAEALPEQWPQHSSPSCWGLALCNRCCHCLQLSSCVSVGCLWQVVFRPLPVWTLKTYLRHYIQSVIALWSHEAFGLELSLLCSHTRL